MGYYDLLKDPRWLKKRKKILKRDEFKCTVCGSTKQLRVHHTYYTGQNTPPWAYPNNSLLTVCNDCHEKYHREHELTIQLHHNPSGKKKKPKKQKIVKPKKAMTLKEHYKVWEPRMKNKKYRLTKYDHF
jgi:5-methylcytosine-specific restriction endonuclease McrA